MPSTFVVASLVTVPEALRFVTNCEMSKSLANQLKFWSEVVVLSHRLARSCAPAALADLVHVAASALRYTSWPSRTV